MTGKVLHLLTVMCENRNLAATVNVEEHQYFNLVHAVHAK